MQQVPEEEVALRERVHGILLEASSGGERMTSSAASECLYGAGLGLRYVQASHAGRCFERQPVRGTRLLCCVRNQRARGGGVVARCACSQLGGAALLRPVSSF